MSAPLAALSLLYGEDEFSICERLEHIKRQLGNQNDVAFNISEFDGVRLNMAELGAVCHTMPFLSERRIVIVHNAVGQAPSGRESQVRNGDVLSDLTAALSELSRTCSLVLVESRAKFAGNGRRIAKLLRAVKDIEGASIAHYSVPKGDQLVAWIVRRVRGNGGEITHAAASGLALRHEGSLRYLHNEIVKLLSFVGEARPVSVGDVDLLTGAPSGSNIFRLVDALAQRNGKLATAQMCYLLDQERQEPLQVFAMIVRQYRLLLLTKELLGNGSQQGDVQRRLGLPQFVAAKIISQCGGYRLRSLETIYRSLLALDIAMKSGADRKTSLNLLVCRLVA